MSAEHYILVLFDWVNRHQNSTKPAVFIKTLLSNIERRWLWRHLTQRDIYYSKYYYRESQCYCHFRVRTTLSWLFCENDFCSRLLLAALQSYFRSVFCSCRQEPTARERLSQASLLGNTLLIKCNLNHSIVYLRYRVCLKFWSPLASLSRECVPRRVLNTKLEGNLHSSPGLKTIKIRRKNKFHICFRSNVEP